MSGSLDHFPADIIRQLLIDLGVGLGVTATDWPAFSQKEPDSPDNVITVFDTMGRDLGRTNPDMVRSERYGIQVRDTRRGYRRHGSTGKVRRNGPGLRGPSPCRDRCYVVPCPLASFAVDLYSVWESTHLPRDDGSSL
jgi:hypothetical protein